MPDSRANQAIALRDLELARGHFDDVRPDGGGVVLTGWTLLPDHPFSSFSIFRDERFVESLEPMVREDVGHAFPWISHARRSGFRFLSPLREGETARVDVVGCRRDRPVARLTTLVRLYPKDAVAVPPRVLLDRVMGPCAEGFYKSDGLKCFSDFVFGIRRHRELHTIRRMLDWGCGCGRMSVHFLLDGGIRELHGCDIDGDAIAWCRDNLAAGRFTRVEPWPPTAYEDGMFDLVIGYSVFTHLQRDVQNAWLAEMRRLIAPGGLFLTSVHGDFAARFAFPPRGGRWRRLGRRLRDGLVGWAEPKRIDGISDETLDPALDGVAPAGYYRGVFQSRDYTVREWSRYFEVLEYVERGAGNYQDLVVMRRPP